MKSNLANLSNKRAAKTILKKPVSPILPHERKSQIWLRTFKAFGAVFHEGRLLSRLSFMDMGLGGWTEIRLI